MAQDDKAGQSAVARWEATWALLYLLVIGSAIWGFTRCDSGWCGILFGVVLLFLAFRASYHLRRAWLAKAGRDPGDPLDL